MARADTSVAVFGSRARGDADSCSDKDLLVVGGPTREPIEHALSGRGWEVSGWSWEELASLAADGSLFVLHLSRESRVLHDPQHQLRDLLSSFTPRADYDKELDDAIKLCRIASLVPNCPRGFAWAADVLSCALRTYAIPSLFCMDVPCFANAEIASNLRRVHGLSSSEYDCALHLRVYKRSFRSGAARCSWFDLREAFKLVCKVTGQPLELQRVDPEEIVKRAVERIQVESNGYLVSRITEGALIAKATNSPQEVELYEGILNPHRFAYSFSEGGELRQTALQVLRAVA